MNNNLLFEIAGNKNLCVLSYELSAYQKQMCICSPINFYINLVIWKCHMNTYIVSNTGLKNHWPQVWYNSAYSFNLVCFVHKWKGQTRQKHGRIHFRGVSVLTCQDDWISSIPTTILESHYWILSYLEYFTT